MTMSVIFYGIRWRRFFFPLASVFLSVDIDIVSAPAHFSFLEQQ